MPVLKNISDKVFHLPPQHGLTKERGEPEDYFFERISRAWKSPELKIFGGQAVEVDDGTLEMMQAHPVAKHWFGRDITRGQGLVVAGGPDDVVETTPVVEQEEEKLSEGGMLTADPNAGSTPPTIPVDESGAKPPEGG